MTKIKLCGLSRPADIEAANRLRPDYIGFVFAAKSKRAVTPETAGALKGLLLPEIRAVGVFVDEEPETVAGLLNNGTIELGQLHGHEDEGYLRRLRALTDRPLIQAFRIASEEDLRRAEASRADAILLDAGAGTGTVFDWSLLRSASREYFLAGGLSAENVGAAIRQLHPFAVDVSSGIESGGVKDPEKMAAFVAAVREEEQR
jgi:phosphoribosylanthranilate isomerase